MIVKKEDLSKISEILNKVPSNLFDKTCVKLEDGQILIENLSNKMSYMVSFEINAGIQKDEKCLLRFSTKKSMEKILNIYDEMIVNNDEEYIVLNKYNKKGEEISSLTLPIFIEKEEMDNIPHNADEIFDIIINNAECSHSKIEFYLTPDEVSEILTNFSILDDVDTFEMIYDKKGLHCEVKDIIQTKVVRKFEDIKASGELFKSSYGPYLINLLKGIKFNKNVDKMRVIVGEPLTIFEIKDGDNTYIYAVTVIED